MGDIQCSILQLMKKTLNLFFHSASSVGMRVHPGQFESERDEMRTHHCKKRICMARSTSPPVERASPSPSIITVATKCPLPRPRSPMLCPTIPNLIIAYLYRQPRDYVPHDIYQSVVNPFSRLEVADDNYDNKGLKKHCFSIASSAWIVECKLLTLVGFTASEAIWSH